MNSLNRDGWEKKFDKEFDYSFCCGGDYCDIDDNGDTHDIGEKKRIKSFIRTLLEEQETKWRQILNSGRKMYQLGVQDERNRCLEALPKKKEFPNPQGYDMDGLEIQNQEIGFNSAIDQAISALSDNKK